VTTHSLHDSRGPESDTQAFALLERPLLEHVHLRRIEAGGHDAECHCPRGAKGSAALSVALTGGMMGNSMLTWLRGLLEREESPRRAHTRHGR